MMRLSATQLACHRGGRDVFAGISFNLGSGELLAIAGLVRMAGGDLLLEGGDPELTIAEQAHYLGHLDALKPALSVGENLRFWAGFLGTQPAETGSALEAVGLQSLSDLPAGYLSAGQRRRLSIARLLAVKRPIWLLDEPMSTLDAAAQERLTGVMRTHLANDGLILAATHGPLGITASQELRLGKPL